jgi:hypothetical protein
MRRPANIMKQSRSQFFHPPEKDQGEQNNTLSHRERVAEGRVRGVRLA